MYLISLDRFDFFRVLRMIEVLNYFNNRLKYQICNALYSVVRFTVSFSWQESHQIFTKNRFRIGIIPVINMVTDNKILNGT